MAKELSIVGGGLAGLTLGILLREKGMPVTVLEAGDYPRHRVCGEFISGSGLTVLKQLDLFKATQSVSGRFAKTAAVFDQRGGVTHFDLPEPAFCISRYTLDALLAERFEKEGGILQRKTRWKESFAQNGVVRATGRRPPEVRAGGWRWFGLKVHCRNLETVSDLEMHFRPDGYIGICRLLDGEVNLCGLFRSQTALPELASEWKCFLAGKGESQLKQKLRSAEYDESSFCSIAALDPNGSQPATTTELRIGDALGMIPPVTGNGMSIAFESAAIAAKSLTHYLVGKGSWAQAIEEFGKAWQKQISKRLKVDRALHPFLFNAGLQRIIFSNRMLAVWLLQKVFHATR